MSAGRVQIAREFEERVCGHGCSRSSGSLSARTGRERGTGGGRVLTGRVFAVVRRVGVRSRGFRKRG